MIDVDKELVGKRVAEVTRDDLRWQGRGKPSSLRRRVAIIGGWTAQPLLSRSVCEYARQLSQLGYDVILSIATDFDADLEWRGAMPERTWLLRKPNIGYDFGSWAVVFDQLPELYGCARVLVTNDSLVGPFASIAPMISSLDNTPCDYWGATRSLQVLPHAQSFIMGFTPTVLTSGLFQEFWRNVRIWDDKNEVIRLYELGLSRMLWEEGFVCEGMFEGLHILGDNRNPVIAAWREMLDLGFPFVKRALITPPADFLTNRDYPNDLVDIPQYVREHFREDVTDWL